MKFKLSNSFIFDIFNFYERLFGSIIRKSKFLRQGILFTIDGFLIISSLFFTNFFINIDNLVSIKFIYLYSTIFGLLIYVFTGQYKELTKYSSSSISFTFINIFYRNTFLIICLVLFSSITNINNPSLKFWIQFWFLLNLIITLSKIFLSDLLLSYLKRRENKKNIIIYGANSSAFELAIYIMNTRMYNIDCFLEDNKKFWGRKICGIPILNPNEIENIYKKVDQIFISLPNLNSEKKYFLLNKFSKYGLPLILVPTIEELSSGRIKIEQSRKLDPEDLLFREAKNTNKESSKKLIKNSVVCITGAGGSIGSELCKQILELNPSKLVLIELNEHSLWKIEKELSDLKNEKLEIRPILANLNDFQLIKKIILNEKVEIIFHAAAYKHVPLVELNPLEGLKNNIFTTYNLCKACESTYMKNFVLISTDKAVRPTNLMGASKRISEVILQYNDSNKYLNLSGQKIVYSSVRFGNVLGSSGSVVPIFQSQIKAGGPITITHKDIKRFFMTIKEAVGLVIESTTFAKGGEVFLLDMGKQVPIINLAKLMISKRGLTIKDKNNPEGDIEIIETGLRPGEKLYEETLIHGKSEKTENKLIYKAEEKSNISQELIKDQLEELKINIENSNLENCLKIVKTFVPSWNRSKFL